MGNPDQDLCQSSVIRACRCCSSPARPTQHTCCVGFCWQHWGRCWGSWGQNHITALKRALEVGHQAGAHALQQQSRPTQHSLNHRTQTQCPVEHCPTCCTEDTAVAHNTRQCSAQDTCAAQQGQSGAAALPLPAQHICRSCSIQPSRDTPEPAGSPGQ